MFLILLTATLCTRFDRFSKQLKYWNIVLYPLPFYSQPADPLFDCKSIGFSGVNTQLNSSSTYARGRPTGSKPERNSAEAREYACVSEQRFVFVCVIGCGCVCVHVHMCINSWSVSLSPSVSAFYASVSLRHKISSWNFLEPKQGRVRRMIHHLLNLPIIPCQLIL